MQDKEKKPKFSVFENMKFLLGKYWSYNKWAFITMVVIVPITLGVQFLTIYLPKVIVEQIELGYSFEQMIGMIGSILAVLAILTTVEHVIKHTNKCRLDDVKYGIDEEVVRQGLTIQFEKLESKKFQNLFREANYCTENWGGRVRIFSLPQSIVDLVQSILGYILFGTLIAVVNPSITVILTLTPLIPYYFTRKYQHYEYKNREHWTLIDRIQWYIGYSAGAFEYGKDIRAYEMKGWLSSTYDAMSKERLYWDRKLLGKGMRIDMASLCTILIRDGLAYIVLVQMVLAGEMSASTFVMLFAAVGTFSERINEIIRGWGQLQEDHLRICDLHEFLESEEIDDTSYKTTLQEAPSTHEYSLEIKNLTYRYEGATSDTLKSINVKIRAGEKIAIVGWNGAGKTTLIKNICGLYQPTTGEVCLNGKASTADPLDRYYEHFACIFQDVTMMPYSIAEFVSATIAEQIDRERVLRSIQLAGLGSKIEKLRHGIDTRLNKKLNQEGIELSGGEQQKLLLARAIYQDAPILILDEPTAAMDPIAENEVYLKYNQITENKIAFFISHRLASTKFCDRILLMENGEVIEEGTHDALMAQGGKYYELFTVQSRHYGDREADLALERVGGE